VATTMPWKPVQHFRQIFGPTDDRVPAWRENTLVESQTSLTGPRLPHAADRTPAHRGSRRS
jgi:hypothetical protein